MEGAEDLGGIEDDTAPVKRRRGGFQVASDSDSAPCRGRGGITKFAKRGGRSSAKSTKHHGRAASKGGTSRRPSSMKTPVKTPVKKDAAASSSAAAGGCIDLEEDKAGPARNQENPQGEIDPSPKKLSEP